MQHQHQKRYASAGCVTVAIVCNPYLRIHPHAQKCHHIAIPLCIPSVSKNGRLHRFVAVKTAEANQETSAPSAISIGRPLVRTILTLCGTRPLVCTYLSVDCVRTTCQRDCVHPLGSKRMVEKATMISFSYSRHCLR